jgi:hypothetical protein
MCLPWRHRWQIKERVECGVYAAEGAARPVGNYITYILECVNCGWLKRRKFET